MFREFLRSTLYSSSRPFSSRATRDSSFSTLSMSLLPVLREERPKIFFTLSIIKLKRLTDQKWNCRYVLPGSLWSKVHRVPRRRLGGGGVGAGTGCRRTPNSRSKKLRGAGGAAGRARATGALARRRTLPCESASGSTSGDASELAIC